MSFLDKNKTGFFTTMPIAMILSTGYAYENLPSSLDLKHDIDIQYPIELNQTYSSKGLSITNYKKVNLEKNQEELFKEFVNNAFSQIQNASKFGVDEKKDQEIDIFFTKFHNKYQHEKTKKLYIRA